MDKGEIWLVEFPYLAGREQIGKRPAVILADTKTSLVTIIPLTTQSETLKYHYIISVESSDNN